MSTKCKMLEHLFGSTAEAETGGLFINGQNIVPIQTSLIDLDHI